MTTTTSLITGTDFITVPTKDYDAAAEFYGTPWTTRSISEREEARGRRYDESV